MFSLPKVIMTIGFLLSFHIAYFVFKSNFKLNYDPFRQVFLLHRAQHNKHPKVSSRAFVRGPHKFSFGNAWCIIHLCNLR